MYSFCCRFDLDSLDDDDKIWMQRTDIYNRTRDLHISVTVREAFEVIRNYLIWKTLCDVSILCTFSDDGKNQVTVIDTGLKSHKKIPYYYAMDEEITRFNQSRELHLANAHEIIRMLRAEEIKPKCLVDVCKQRHLSQDSKVHSTPTTCFERAETFIKANLKDTILGGCPVLIEDLNEVENVRTTFGSVLYADFVPKQSDPTVCLLETNGAVVVKRILQSSVQDLKPSIVCFLPHDLRVISGQHLEEVPEEVQVHLLHINAGLLRVRI